MSKSLKSNYVSKKKTIRKGNVIPANKRTQIIARAEAKRVLYNTLETKIHDISAVAQAVDWGVNGLVVSLTNGMVRGTGESDYLGDQIIPIGVLIRAQIFRLDDTQLFRIIIIQNKAGGVPLLSTLLASVTNVTAPLSPYDVDYNNTYRVLYDRLYSMDVTRQRSMITTIRLPARKLRKIYFNDAAGSLEKAGLYMLCISDSGASPHPIIDYRARLYYKDA